MRRGLDAAKAEIAALTDRDAILDCFFRYAASLFEFGVLFVVRHDVAHGRNVHGIGAPKELVTRLAFPLSEPGILATANDKRKPFVAMSAMVDADARLFGSLGRAMPAALVVPLVVRSRTIAIFLADAPTDELLGRARAVNRAPIELAKEEMLLWSEAASEAVERYLIKRRGAPASNPDLPTSANPLSSDPLLAAEPSSSPHLPSHRLPPPPPPSSARRLAPPPPPTKPAPRIPVAAVAGIAAVVVLASAFGLWRLFRRETPAGEDDVAVRGEKLAGWPSAVDPSGLLETAKRTAGSSRAELASIQAEVTDGGRINFKRGVKNHAGVYASFVYLDGGAESEVRVDNIGVRAPRKHDVTKCGDQSCRFSIPPPQCTFAQIWEGARAVGLEQDDSMYVSYADGRSYSDAAGPKWYLTVPDRGRVRVDATTCKPSAGERFLPAAIPLWKLPGQPNLDPTELLPLAKNQSGLGPDAQLLEIEARGMVDGRVDVYGSIVYTFADPRGDGKSPRRWRQVKVSVGGMPVTPTTTDTQPLPQRMAGPPPPPPRCSFASLYNLFRVVLAGARARVTYGADASGAGKWTIETPETGSHTVTDAACDAKK